MTPPLNLPFVPTSSPPSELTPNPPLRPRCLPAFSHPRPVRLQSRVSPQLALRPDNLALPWTCPPPACPSHRQDVSSLPPNFAGPARRLPRTAPPCPCAHSDSPSHPSVPTLTYPTRPPPTVRPRPRPSLAFTARIVLPAPQTPQP